MPSMEHVGNDIWEKSCTLCKHKYVATAKTWDTAKELMNKYFGARSTGIGYDGLLSQCKSCNNDRTHGRDINNRHAMIEKQGHKCGVCEKPIAISYTRSNEAVVDHCHKTGVTRKIVCQLCNVGLSYIDNDEWLNKAIAYRDLFRCE